MTNDDGMDVGDWWEQLKATHQEHGKRDANRGVFEPPYPNSEDPTEQDENEAYRKGFSSERKKLGDAFKWA